MYYFFSHKHCVVLILLTVIQSGYVQLSAQNLVKNPSFEEFEECPREFGCLERVVPFWHQATSGSTDYFNSCSSNMSSEKNFMGVQSPFEGEGYAGMYMYAPQDYREYLTAELKEPLEPGQKYTFSFYVSRAEESYYSINEFGVLFTNTSMGFGTKKNITINFTKNRKKRNYKIVRNHNYFKNPNDWIEVKGTYIAIGTERFMTIGNFNTNANTDLLKTQTNVKKVAYYYVDMVSLNKLKRDYKLEKVYVFENLLFDTNGYTIADKDEPQIHELIEYLMSHPSYTISIYGHTDSIGSKEYNKTLSRKRAQSVAQYLVKKGLKMKRILWHGYGDLRPIEENDTNEGRTKNRRVEFVLSKKKSDSCTSRILKDDD